MRYRDSVRGDVAKGVHVAMKLVIRRLIGSHAEITDRQ